MFHSLRHRLYFICNHIITGAVPVADMLHVMALSRTHWGRAGRVRLLLSKIQFGSHLIHSNSFSLFFFFQPWPSTPSLPLIFSFTVSLTSHILPLPLPCLSFHVLGKLTLSSLANGDGLYTLGPLGQLKSFSFLSVWGEAVICHAFLSEWTHLYL